MKSVKLKLIVMFTLVILVVVAALGITTITFESRNLLADARYDLETIAQAQAKYIATQRDAELRYVDALAQNAMITDGTVTINEKAAYFKAEAERMGYELFAYADLAGKATLWDGSFEKNDVSDREFFQKAKAGEAASSDLIFSKLDGQPVVVFAAPVKIHNRVVGVFYGRKDGLMLSEISKSITYQNTGYAYVINNQGITVGHQNTDLVLAQDNDIENAKTDPAAKELGALTEKMISGGSGSGEYTYNGTKKIAGYAPIEGSPWIMVLTADRSEILAEVVLLTQLLLVLCLVITAIGVVVTYYISAQLARPIKKITVAAQQIADGNFDVSLLVKSKDEIGDRKSVV